MKRFRYTFMGLGSLFAAILMTVADPDLQIITELPLAAPFIATIAILAKIVLYAGALHYTRKGLFDYIDMQELFTLTKKGNSAAGLALIALGCIHIAIAILIYACTRF